MSEMDRVKINSKSVSLDFDQTNKGDITQDVSMATKGSHSVDVEIEVQNIDKNGKANNLSPSFEEVVKYAAKEVSQWPQWEVQSMKTFFADSDD